MSEFTDNNKERRLSSKKMFLHLLEGTVIFGDCVGITTENGVEIQVKQPFTIKNQKVMPYMTDIVGSAPGAINIHPINVLWSVPLDEFPALEELYTKETSGIVLVK